MSIMDIELAARNILLRVGHLASNMAKRNAYAKGGRSFWRDIGDSIHVVQPSPGEVIVGAAHVAAGIKHFGGRVSAPGKGAGSLHRKALTIPIGLARANRWDTDEAQQAGYELFSDTTDNGVRILFGRSTRHRRLHQREPLFVLRKSAQVPADPFWPEDTDIERMIRQAIDEENARNA